MKHSRLKKAVEKYTTVKKVEGRNDQFYAEFFGRTISWSTKSFNPEDVIFVRVRRSTDRDEIQSDYCAGFFYKTIKEAVVDFLSGLMETEGVEKYLLIDILEGYKTASPQYQDQWVKNMLNLHGKEKESGMV